MTTCGACGGWGCRSCKPPHEVASAEGGEQGLDAVELELVAERNKRREVEASLRGAQAEAAALRTERDALRRGQVTQHPDAVKWLGRLELMARSATVEIHPHEAAELLAVLKGGA